MMVIRARVVVCLLSLAGAAAAPLLAESGEDLQYLERIERELETAAAASPTPTPVAKHLQACVGGMAGGVYPCSNVDLLEFMTHSTFGTASASVKTNSLWGWTDPLTKHEWVLLGLNNGTAFIDITNPESPLYAGKLPTHTGTSNTWRDIRVYQNHAYVVSEQTGHGMQVFDLTQLRNVVAPPVTFSETAFYDKVSNTHTISINEDTGYAYLVGTTGTNGNPNVITCGGNIHVVSLATPTSPQFVGCYNDGGYVHENQCFVYSGPDLDCDPVTPGAQACAGREICLAARGNAHRLDIIDVTNHAAPVRLSSLQYNSVGFSHQAWFTEDQRYILLNDELDEQNAGNPTRTHIFDALDLNAVIKSGGNGYFDHATPAVDHNLYVRGNYVFESNYKAGLRILSLTNLAQSQLTEIGYFDVFPSSNDNVMDGTWNNYPFFASGVIPVSHLTQGLYLVRPTNVCFESIAPPVGLGATPNGDHRIDLTWTGSGTVGNKFVVERALGGCGGPFSLLATDLTTASFDDLTASGGVTYGYRITEVNTSGSCSSGPSSCVEASTTGTCTAPPAFAGLVTATNDAQSTCGITLTWGTATPFCSGPTAFNVYRGTTDTFVPSVANRIAQGVSGYFQDLGAPAGTTSYYVVRAVDSSNGSEEGNVTRRSATATGTVTDGTFTTGAELGQPVLDTLAGGSEERAPEHAGWHVTTDRFRTGARSFHSTSSSSLCVTLQTPPLTLTAGQSSQLSFYTQWDMEPSFDGGIVEVSTNGGGSWTRLTPAGGYPNSITNSGNACPALVGSPPTPAFSSAGQTVSWQQKTVDLSAYAGQAVRLSWRYGSDGGVNNLGWYVDDISLTHAQIPGTCSVIGLFNDGFETGASNRWVLGSP